MSEAETKIEMARLIDTWDNKELKEDEKSLIHKQSLNATKLALEMGDISRDDKGNSCKMIKVSRTGDLPKSKFDIKFYYPEEGDFVRVCIDSDKYLYAKFKHEKGEIILDRYEKKQGDTYENHVLGKEDGKRLGDLKFNVSLIDNKSEMSGNTPEDKIVTLKQKTQIFKFSQKDSNLSVGGNHINKLIFASNKFNVLPENFKGTFLNDETSAHRAIHATLNDQFDRNKSTSSNSLLSSIYTMCNTGVHLTDRSGSSNKDRTIDVVITNSMNGDTIRANTSPSQHGRYSVNRMGKDEASQVR